MPRRLLPLVLAFACGAAPGVEPIVATPYEVRHEVQELLDDIAGRRGDRAALLDRAQTALAGHGDLLLVRNGSAMPIASLVAGALKSAGLDQEFVRTFTPIAERRLAALGDAAASTAALRKVAIGYPGTPASRAAWRRLADRAWDAGSLATFLAYARQAQDGDDPARRARLDAAATLNRPSTGPLPPETVAGIEELWRLDLGEPPVAVRGRQRVAERLEIATGPAEMSAISDGFRLRLFDHVVGRMHGDEVMLGNQPLSAIQARPVALRDGFVAIGLLNEQVRIVAMDSLGRMRWQQTLASPDRAVVSAPVRLDDLVAFAQVAVTREGADLQVVALDAETGRTAWTAQVARLPGTRPMVMAISETAATPPVLAAAGGTLVLCANNGLMARVGADGAVQRVWSYPSIFDDLNSIIATRSGPRGGVIASDGRVAAVSPADYPGTVLVLGPDDDAPRVYTGDNANGDVLDVRDGQALLVGRRVTLVDLATLKPRWTVPWDGDGTMHGRLGGKRLLLAGRGRLAMLDAGDGRTIAQRDLSDLPMSIAVVDDALVLAQNWTLTGLGRGESFLERLTTASRRDPDDYRPLVALASLFEAREDRTRAFDCLVQALARNAPQEYAERAARIVRHDLELAAGDATAFPPALTRLESIVRFDRRQETELSWWRARHAELTGTKAQAVQLYRSVLAGPDRTMLFANRLEMAAHTLAEAGLARLGTLPPPAWYADTAEPVPVPAPVAAWKSSGGPPQHLLVADRMMLGLADGLLTARRLADGGEAWWRAPGRALLGVAWRGLIPDQPGVDEQLGLMVDVMPGSAAAAAGMRSGDRMLTLNGKPTTDFNRDLRSVVLNMPARAPFVIEVERNKERVTCRGHLGGDLVQPVAAAAGIALVWPLAFLPGTNRPLVPEGMWFAAHDLADGRELWRWSLPPVTTERTPIPPLITPQGLVITQDGGDVVALMGRPTGADGPEVRWRVPGLAVGLAGARLLTPHLLWLPTGGRNQVALVDVATGRIRGQLPVSTGAQALVSDGELAIRDADGRPVLWDLALARQRWKGDNGVALLAFCGDGLLVLDDARRPVLLDRINGSLRRTVGDWTMVEDWRIAGDTVLVHARREGRQVLASVSLPGASIRWEVALSSRAEIKTLLAANGSFGCVLGDGPERDSLLLLDGQGVPRTTLRLDAGETVATVLAGGGALILGPAGMRTAVPALPTAPSPLPAIAAEAAGDLAATAAAVLPRLAWQSIGNARYAVARTRNGVLVFADIAPGGPPVEVMLNDGSALIEVAGSPVRFTPDGPVFSVVPGSWLMGGTVRLEPPPGILRRDCVRLDPPPGRLPGMPLSVRASCGNTTDAADAPWWLHQGWREMR